MTDESSRPAGRPARLWRYADARHVLLRTVVVAVAVVAATYLAGKLIYRLRDIVLLMAVAGFLALLLNPIVVLMERKLRLRRGLAVTIVSLAAAAVFLILAYSFGAPQVTGALLAIPVAGALQVLVREAWRAAAPKAQAAPDGLEAAAPG